MRNKSFKVREEDNKIHVTLERRFWSRSIQASIGKKRKKENQSIKLLHVNNTMLDIFYALKNKNKDSELNN